VGKQNQYNHALDFTMNHNECISFNWI